MLPRGVCTAVHSHHDMDQRSASTVYYRRDRAGQHGQTSGSGVTLNHLEGDGKVAFGTGVGTGVAADCDQLLAAAHVTFTVRT